MNSFLIWAKDKLQVDKRLIALYCIVYFSWGMAMDWFGTQVEIARFTYWWQVITCYILYMVPISLLLRKLPFHAQYAYGLIAMCLLEFAGYALESSYAYPDNVLDKVFGIRNFSLGMAMFFALYFPLGNWGVGRLYHLFFKIDP
ncbi:hypothetical protein FGM00_07570 [Aggregatimonas sangjinii]|uniref:Uncharacterized protein n=1 Tax=Aggregatimonas sangjinii TaxID=2583587 RepID=A0A5B7SMT1_9FLAO|nr:hypothetical protein [Aggregatimonas sangjinii]QCW99964.1 hypothetical protein FGM00_07570 [Aggregatimonas sangjinii]